MSIDRSDMPKNVNASEEPMATVDTESLVSGLQTLGEQLEKTYDFQKLRQEDAQEKGNRLFQQSDLDEGAAEKLRVCAAEAFEHCERIECSKGNVINNK